LAKLKNQSLLTLNLRGESHEKGYAEDADTKASGGVLGPLEAFCVHYQDSFPTFLKHNKGKGD